MISSPLTLTTAGTRQPFLAVPADGLPGQRHCNRIAIQLVTPGATVYIGAQGSQGVADSVSSTVYNAILSDDQPTLTLGPFSDGAAVDLCLTWWDASANGTKIAITPMQGLT